LIEDKSTKKYPEYAIDPYQFIVLVWANKWKLILATLFGLIISVLVFLGMPKNYEAKFKFQSPLPGTIESLRVFDTWDLLSIGEKDLFNEYIYELTSLDLLTQGIKTFELIEGSDLTQQEYDDAILDFANSITLDFSQHEDSELLDYYSLNFNGTEKQKLKDFIQWLHQSANDNVSTSLNKRLVQTLEMLDQLVQFEIDQLSYEIDEIKITHEAETNDEILKTTYEIQELKIKDGKELEDAISSVELEINSMRDKYIYDSSDNIEYLSEQLTIANLLDIKEPLLMTEQEGAGVNTIINNVNNPDYYKGSIALQQLIDNINLRTNIDSFIPGLRAQGKELLKMESERGKDEYVSGLRELQMILSLLEKKRDPAFQPDIRKKESDLRLLSLNIRNNYLETLYKNSAVYQGKVEYAIADHRSLRIKNTKQPLYIHIIAGAVLGFVFGGILILMQSIIRRRQLI
tara:strand:- start:260 stop:1639 length:1380 start_codon:yes stop_codon:yes gene_type:complete